MSRKKHRKNKPNNPREGAPGQTGAGEKPKPADENQMQETQPSSESRMQITPSEEAAMISLIHSGTDLTMPQPFERDIFLCHIRVVGMFYVPDIEEKMHKLSAGEKLRLIREPENSYDAYAIRVDSEASGKLGYIPSKKNHILARLLDAGKEIYGIVDDISSEQGFLQIVIRVYMRD